jgi:hypothetical protein
MIVLARPEDVDIYRGRRIPQMSDLLLLRAVATRLQGASSSYSPKCLEGRRSRKPHSPGPTPTSVPDSDRLPSGNCHATDRTCSVYGCNGLGRTHAAFPEAHNTLWKSLYLSTLPHPATEPLDSPLVCPAQERLDLLKGFVGRV